MPILERQFTIIYLKKNISDILFFIRRANYLNEIPKTKDFHNDLYKKDTKIMHIITHENR